MNKNPSKPERPLTPQKFSSFSTQTSGLNLSELPARETYRCAYLAARQAIFCEASRRGRAPGGPAWLHRGRDACPGRRTPRPNAKKGGMDGSLPCLRDPMPPGNGAQVSMAEQTRAELSCTASQPTSTSTSTSDHGPPAERSREELSFG